MKTFYDTSALLDLLEEVGQGEAIISSVSLQELEKIKNSANASDLLKYKARVVTRVIEKHQDLEIIIPNNKVKKIMKRFQLQDNNDGVILASAFLSGAEVVKSSDSSFVNIGRRVLNLVITNTKKKKPRLCNYGVVDVFLPEKEVEDAIKRNENIFGLKTNNYVIFNTEEARLPYLWDGEKFVEIIARSIKSFHLGETIAPLDAYQMCATDSLYRNQITAISGKAGSGKSTLALFGAMNLIEKRKFDKLVIMANPVPLRGTKEIGFLPGNREDKLLAGNLGNILISKFGCEEIVTDLISKDMVSIINMSDCRGMEIGRNQILYCTEVQNTSVDILKMVLQRPAEGAKIIIEGDYEAQVDSYLYEGRQNGLKRAIEVFEGEDYFGAVNLPLIHRSRVAQKASEL